MIKQDLPRERLQARKLLVVQSVRSGFVVDDAERAERLAVRRPQQGAGIKADMRLVHDEWTVHRARIFRQIRNDERRLFESAWTPTLIERRLAGGQGRPPP